MFTIRAGKATPGQYFDGLDMLTKLLAPSGRATAAVPLIETLGEGRSWFKVNLWSLRAGLVRGHILRLLGSLITTSFFMQQYLGIKSMQIYTYGCQTKQPFIN